MFWVKTKHKKYSIILKITMKNTTAGEVPSIRVRLVQPTILTTPLAEQAGGSSSAYITYTIHAQDYHTRL